MSVSTLKLFQNVTLIAESETTNVPVQNEENIKSNYIYGLCRYFLGFLICVSTFFLWNTIRLIREKCEGIRFEERQAYNQYILLKNACKKLAKAQKTQHHSIKSNMKRLKGFRFGKRRLIFRKKSSVLWKKLHRLQPVNMSKESISVSETSYLIEKSNQTSIEEQCCYASKKSSCEEISTFLPPLQSTVKENKTFIVEEVTSLNSSDYNQPFTMEMLKSPEISSDMYDPHPGLLAPSQLPIYNNTFQTSSMFGLDSSVQTSKDMSANSCLNDNCTSNLHSAQDSGYQGFNESTNMSCSSNTKKVSEIIQKVEKYNQMKNAELSGQIQKAQEQAKREVNQLQSLFRIPPENVKFTKAEIYDCPELRSRQKLLRQLRKRIDDVKTDIKDTNERTVEMEKPFKKPVEDSFTLLKRSMFWQQKQEERMAAAHNSIVRAVKSTMETRFRGMVNLKQKSVTFDGKNWCYDCATKRHDQYFIDGVDGCPVDNGPKILCESDGFNPSCSVVKVINSWYKDVVNGKYKSTQHKADEMDRLLKRVLKEMYLKRYYERGQLISQTYLTVSSHLDKFVFISPKESIPYSEE